MAQLVDADKYVQPFMVVDTASWLNSQSAVGAVSRH